MTLSRLFLPVVLLSSLAFTTEALSAGCLSDADCKPPHVCLEGTCMQLGPTESLLRVDLATPIDSAANLFIDERYMGELPWSGIVERGWHSIRVEAYGRLPSSFRGESRGGMADTLQITLEPDPAFAAPAPQPAHGGQSQPAAETGGDGGSDKPGMISIGVFGGGAFGTAQWGTERTQRPALKFLGGGALGVRLVGDPVWLDLMFAMSYSAFQIKDPPGLDEDDVQGAWSKPAKGAGLQFALQARLLFPIKEHFFYLGAELEPGYIYSAARWGYADLHLAMSLFFNEFVELRINPLGGEFAQELTGEGFIAGFHATIGLAVRFFNP
jgi:hypothetical protein